MQHDVNGLLSWRRVAALALLGALAACAGGLPSSPEDQAREAAYRERYAKAKALFEERCKTAGAVIKRTVKDVEGIELLRVRPVLEWGDKRYFDPTFEGAAMADEYAGVGFLAGFLYSEYRNQSTPDRRGQIKPPDVPASINEEAPRRGYRFVDAPDPTTGESLRYSTKPDMTEAKRRALGGFGRDLTSFPRDGRTARYAVDYEDIVDPTDRAYWVAGTRIKVIDRQTGEVIAQLTRYVWDRGFGGSSTGRWPWQHASAQGNECPYYLGTRSYETRFFVDTVLIPKQGD